MSSSKLRDIKIQRDFKNETNLYHVEPLVQIAPTWRNLKEVPDRSKAIPLHFQELRGKNLYAKFLSVNDTTRCWKLYIVGSSNICVLYVEPGALNPVGQYNRNQKKS